MIECSMTSCAMSSSSKLLVHAAGGKSKCSQSSRVASPFGAAQFMFSTLRKILTSRLFSIASHAISTKRPISYIMAVRKASNKSSKLNGKGKEESEADGLLPPAPGSGPSRRSARQANVNWNKQYADASDAIKQEISTTPSKNGAKRSAGDVDATPGSAKRVKFDNDEAGEVKVEVADSRTGLLSPEDTDESELSDVKSEDESEPEQQYEADSADSEDVDMDEEEDADFAAKKKKSKKSPQPKAKKSGKSAKKTPDTPKTEKAAAKSTGSPQDKAARLQAKKLKEYAQFSKQSPFPDFKHPTPDEARLGHRILAKIHGERIRPEKVVANPNVAGCGDSPSVLDALVRTILSQNTSDKNSTRAKLSMDEVYGGSDQWEDIVKGGQPKLQDAIKSGGLSVTKSKVIISILEQVKEKYGKYSLDHMFEKSDEEAMQELISFQGVGPKTASCVLLFCLQRESFAVDTHVYRIAGLLGWRPQGASRDETHAHLEVRIPDEEKYGLHILMVGHGKKCEECKAGGKSIGKCELRKAFRKGKLQGEAGEDIKEEEEEEIKAEELDGEDKKENIKKEHEDDDWEDGQKEYVHGMESGKKQDKGKAKPKSKSKSK